MSPQNPKARRVRVPMPEQRPEQRRRNFEEVNLGYTEQQAREEAARCLQCGKPACITGCPIGVKIPEFLARIVQGDFLGAAAKIREDNPLPAVTGRVCPQEQQCEKRCVLGRRFEPVGIGHLERFVADYEIQHRKVGEVRSLPLDAEKRVAIVGSGPAGLAAAGDLIRAGCAVTVFEALHEPGGVLMYGIPEFRLPKWIVRFEIENLRRLGVRFEVDTVIGRTLSIDDLLTEEGYDAVFIATGAGLPKFLGIEGEHLLGVYSANEFLTRVNLMHAYRFPEYDTPIYDCQDKDVVVIGGGNTAMDAVRTALRLGARRAMILYRRSEAEMPARVEEIRHAKEEGVEFITLTAPLAFLGDEEGWLRAIRCQRMELGEPDESGRRRPIPIPGSEFELPAQVAIVAVGAGANPLVQSTTPHLKTNAKGYIEVDPETMQTSRPRVFAGGDIVTGAATVIQAMAAGRKAAAAILRSLEISECRSTR